MASASVTFAGICQRDTGCSRILQHAGQIGGADDRGELLERLARQRQQPTLEASDLVAEAVELGGSEHCDPVPRIAEALERLQHLDHTLVRAGGAAEEEQSVGFSDTEAAADLGPVVALRVEGLLVARVGHDQSAVALLQRDVRHGQPVGRWYQRFAGLRPRLSERQREITVRTQPRVLERRGPHALTRAEEGELVVVDVEHERFVRDLGGEDAKGIRRKPRLRDEERVGVDAAGDRLHDREVLGEHLTLERVDRNGRLPQRWPDADPVARELRAPDLDVEPPAQQVGQHVRTPERVVPDVPGQHGDLRSGPPLAGIRHGRRVLQAPDTVGDSRSVARPLTGARSSRGAHPLPWRSTMKPVAVHGALRRRSAAALAIMAILAIVGTSLPAGAGGPVARSVGVTRAGRDASVRFRTRVAGEEIVDITAAAPGISWEREGSESAVVRLSVDGVFVGDDVVMAATPITRSFDLGPLPPGRHVLSLHFDADASAATANVVHVHRTRFHTVAAGTPAYVALSHSPVLFGRNGAGTTVRTGPYQNAVTDSPLVAWHEDTAAATPGHRILRYSIVWSNEDGGTSTPALMARWGRTTDIEWIYQVEVDALGRSVAGTAVFQSPNHGTTVFAGAYEGSRPRLQTCTLNNNVCDHVDDPMRFSLSTEETLDGATQAREQVMDANPWTYRIMAEEARREGKVVADPDPAQTHFIADPDDYLYLVVGKHTIGANDRLFWVGLAIGVRLKGDDTLYRSDKGLHADWSLQRDGFAATTVQLPPGTRRSDIAEIDAIRVPFGPDTGVTVEVNAINRAFFLSSRDQPRPSFLSGPTPATLTAASPTATLYASP